MCTQLYSVLTGPIVKHTQLKPNHTSERAVWADINPLWMHSAAPACCTPALAATTSGDILIWRIQAERYLHQRSPAAAKLDECLLMLVVTCFDYTFSDSSAANTSARAASSLRRKRRGTLPRQPTSHHPQSLQPAPSPMSFSGTLCHSAWMTMRMPTSPRENCPRF